MLANSHGQVTDTYAYDTSGNLLAQTGTMPTSISTGTNSTTATLASITCARWYNPAAGRFMSRDPYGGSIYDPASLHRHNYAAANPVKYIDPSGHADLVVDEQIETQDGRWVVQITRTGRG